MIESILNKLRPTAFTEADFAFIGVPPPLRDHMQILHNRGTKRSFNRLMLLRELCLAYKAVNVRMAQRMSLDDLEHLPPAFIVPEVFMAWSEVDLAQHLEQVQFPHRYEIRIMMAPVGTQWTHHIEVERNGLRIRKFEPMHKAAVYEVALSTGEQDAEIVAGEYRRIWGVEEVSITNAIKGRG